MLGDVGGKALVALPAHAGMKEFELSKKKRGYAVPRARGDEPDWRDAMKAECDCFLAHVGMIR